MADKPKKNRKKEEKPQSIWPGLTNTIGYGLFILLVIYITFIVSRKVGLNLGICPFVIPGCSR